MSIQGVLGVLVDRLDFGVRKGGTEVRELSRH